MWTFTKDGFFSAVQDRHCNACEVMVRTRVRRDLVRLLAKLGKSASDIITLPDSSYRYRARLAKQEWAYYLSSEAINLDYASVKDSITDGLYERSEAYQLCWQALYYFQEETIGV